MMASLGCLYGILAVPTLQTMHIYNRTASVQSRAPLVRVPRWLLNSVVLATPLLLIGSVVGPGLLLVRDIKITESYTSERCCLVVIRSFLTARPHLIVSLINTLRSWSAPYEAGFFPNAAAQINVLQRFERATDLAETTRSRWRPVFIVW